MLGIAKKIFGSSNDRKVKDFMGRVQKINALEAKYAALSDDELRMMVDPDSKRISRGAEGEAVFLPQGGTTDFTENANSVLRTLHEGMQATTDFTQTLMSHDLLESFVLDVERPDGSHGQLVGYYIIHEERLAALDASIVGLLHQADYLQPIYMAIASLSNFTKLIKRHLARQE